MYITLRKLNLGLRGKNCALETENKDRDLNLRWLSSAVSFRSVKSLSQLIQTGSPQLSFVIAYELNENDGVKKPRLRFLFFDASIF